MKSIEVDGTILKMQMWDTAGQERFTTITNTFYKGKYFPTMTIRCILTQNSTGLADLSHYLSDLLTVFRRKRYFRLLQCHRREKFPKCRQLNQIGAGKCSKKCCDCACGEQDWFSAWEKDSIRRWYPNKIILVLIERSKTRWVSKNRIYWGVCLRWN